MGTAGLIAALALGVAACGSDDDDAAAGAGATAPAGNTTTVDAGKAAPETPVDPQVAAAAKEEGTVLLYTNANEEQTQPLVEGFEREYPGVKVKTLSLNGEEVVQRYLSEQASGGTTADVIMNSNAIGWLGLVERGAIADYEDPNVANLPDHAKLAPGVVAVSEDPMMAFYNKAVLPEDQQPDTLADLAKMAGSLKGKIGTANITTTPQAYEATASYLEAAGDAGWKNLEQLGGSTKVESSTGSLITKLAQGQYAAAFLVPGSVRPLLPDDLAKIVTFKYLTDATVVVPRGIGLTKSAKSPNAGKAFINYALSVEGQEAACRGGITPYRDGVECPFGLAATRAELGDDKLIFGTYDEALADERQAILDRWKAAFGR